MNYFGLYLYRREHFEWVAPDSPPRWVCANDPGIIMALEQMIIAAPQEQFVTMAAHLTGGLLSPLNRACVLIGDVEARPNAGVLLAYAEYVQPFQNKTCVQVVSGSQLERVCGRSLVIPSDGTAYTGVYQCLNQPTKLL